MVVLAPLVFSVVLLVVELHLPPKMCKALTDEEQEDKAWTKDSFEVTITVETVKLVFYNIATTILLLVFSKK